MKRKILSNLIALIALISMLGAFGCSNNTANPAVPDLNLEGSREAVEADTNQIMAVYDLYFDPDTMTLEATEVRTLETHYDITAYVGPSCTFALITYDPILRKLIFDMTMTNPSTIDVYDVRTLLLEIPFSGYTLKNADDYTLLFNLYSTSYPNPFMAFAKSEADRKFAAGATHTENFDIELPIGFTPPLMCRLLVECSYPGNCEEPYIIENQAVSGPINSTTSALISLDTHDHQNNVGDVKVDTTPITGGMTTLSQTSPDHWEANVVNSAGAGPGIYRSLIISDSWSSAPNLYDYLEIEVIPDTTMTPGWHKNDFVVPFQCSMDLGVIANPGGARDSEILTIGSNSGSCDAIMENQYHYGGAQNLYADLFNADPTNPDYKPYPVLRLDAADDGAFSFTNINWTDLFISPPWIYNAMVWTCYNRIPGFGYGPLPFDTRYWFDTASNYDTMMRPADVCDDFSLTQYALFTSTVEYSPMDLLFIGTTTHTYNHDNVRYLANLDTWAGTGSGKVDTDNILGIDVVDTFTKGPTAMLYVLEQSGAAPQVEIFQIIDTASGWGYDAVSHIGTINVSYGLYDDPTHVELANGKDIEILPVNPAYELNPNDPTVCVLVKWGSAETGWNGEIMLYNANSGAFLEKVGDSMGFPALKDADVQYLDTDDGPDWEIHVSNIDAAGNSVVSVFNHI